MYGGVPPAADVLAVPSQAKLHEAGVAVVVDVKTVGSVKVTVALSGQVPLSSTWTVKVPAHSPVA